jgi:flagellin
VSFRINNNIPAMTALRNLGTTGAHLEGSIDRLSSGLRINSAADDPAGLIISEGMRSQITGLDGAIRNSQDAVNMSKTAEGALDEIQTLLRNMRGLAVSSANSGVVDAAVLQANQTQIRSTIQSINRIAQQTQFGTKKLLDGTAGALANVTAANSVSSIFMGGTFDGFAVASGPITISKVVQGTVATVATDKTFATPTTIVPTAGSFVINGFSFQSSGNDTLQSIASKVNDMASTTGVTAQVVGTAGAYSITLTQNTYGSQHRIDFFDPSGILNTTANVSTAGIDAVFNVSANTINGVQTVPFTGGRSSSDSGLKLTDVYGNNLVLNENGNANITAATQVGVLTAGTVQFQIGANAGQAVQFSMPTVFANRLGTGAIAGQSVATLDVTSQQGANIAMSVIDDAITQLSRARGEIGSFQSDFLESTVRSLNVAKENLTSSESQIRDADMAQEITQFTKAQILQQSGMSVLAQANQLPQQILQLLKGG